LVSFGKMAMSKYVSNYCMPPMAAAGASSSRKGGYALSGIAKSAGICNGPE
jgi:hypothetical protein